jgi:MFS transporter, AAHS family, 4-hydroxybenzoate transporter
VADIRVSDLVDDRPIGAFQISVFVLCAACLVLDGFDVQAMGYVAPALIDEWRIPNSALGPVFGAALFGILIGSFLFSMMADKVGRRPALIVAVFMFGLLTLMTARAGSVGGLIAIRFLSGIGLGGIMPNAMTLTGEYSPRRIRVFLMMFIANGFNVGAVLGGFLSAWLIPAFGWRSVFYLGGALPLLLAAIMIFTLPESLQLLALKGRRDAIARWVKRIDPAAATGSHQYVVQEQQTGGVPLVYLFHDGRAAGTVLLWIVNFMNLLNLYFLASWLPTVVRDAGHPLATAVLVGTTLQAGGTIGTIALGWLIARRGFAPVLTASFTLAALSVAMIGQPSIQLTALYGVVFVAGLTVIGGQGAINALAVTYYPTHLRSTGIGAGLGVGRIGAIIGPTLAAALMARQWMPRELFLAAAVPALIAALVMIAMRFAMKPAPTAASPRPAESSAV